MTVKLSLVLTVLFIVSKTEAGNAFGSNRIDVQCYYKNNFEVREPCDGNTECARKCKRDGKYTGKCFDTPWDQECVCRGRDVAVGPADFFCIYLNREGGQEFCKNNRSCSKKCKKDNRGRGRCGHGPGATCNCDRIFSAAGA